MPIDNARNVKTHIHNTSFCSHNTSHNAPAQTQNFSICKLDLLWLWWLQHTHTHAGTQTDTCIIIKIWWVSACMNYPWSCWNHFGTQEICEMYFLLLLLRVFCKIIGIPMSLYCMCCSRCVNTKQRHKIHKYTCSHTKRRKQIHQDTRSYLVRLYANEWKMPRIILNIRHESCFESYFHISFLVLPPTVLFCLGQTQYAHHFAPHSCCWFKSLNCKEIFTEWYNRQDIPVRVSFLFFRSFVLSFFFRSLNLFAL